MNELAKDLRAARVRYQNGDNKTLFSKELGVSRHTITQIENKPELVTFGTIQKYCDKVGYQLTITPSNTEG